MSKNTNGLKIHYLQKERDGHCQKWGWVHVYSLRLNMYI